MAKIYMYTNQQEKAHSHLERALSLAEGYASLPQSFGYDAPWLKGYEDDRRTVDGFEAFVERLRAEV